MVLALLLFDLLWAQVGLKLLTPPALGVLFLKLPSDTALVLRSVGRAGHLGDLVGPGGLRGSRWDLDAVLGRGDLARGGGLENLAGAHLG